MNTSIPNFQLTAAGKDYIFKHNGPFFPFVKTKTKIQKSQRKARNIEGLIICTEIRIKE